MRVKRDYYLNKLIEKRDNGLVKIVTGMRRCGKSYLLFNLYYLYLLQEGVEEDAILRLPLDELQNARYRNPLELDARVREFASDPRRRYYIFLDEIQFVKEIANPWLPDAGETIGFVDVVLGLMKLPNADIYITGSNSKMLSSEVVTQFRDKGDEIRVHPFVYTEICRAQGEESDRVWAEYVAYGGLPRVFSFTDRRDKVDYLSKLFENTYLRDVLERYAVRGNKDALDDLIRTIASSVGSLSNPKKLADTFRSKLGTPISPATVARYLDMFVDSFLIAQARRYDVKGRKYIGSPLKYYFSDVGLRNALLEFRQQEENHIMENILYNELTARGYSVDVGVVEKRERTPDGKDARVNLEIDFIAQNGLEKLYVQSALNVDSPEKQIQETESLRRIDESFRKIVVVKAPIVPWVDRDGIQYVGAREFLSGGALGLERV